METSAEKSKEQLEEDQEGDMGTDEGGKEEKERSPKYFDEDGGIELVSSDGVRFRLPAYQLQANSSVFRDVIALGSYPPIELTDELFETSDVITALFDICIGNENIAKEPGGISRPVAHAVINLAQKYDFDKALNTIRLQLRSTLLGPAAQPWRAFELAASIGDPATCVEALKTSAPWQYTQKKIAAGDTAFGDSVPTGGLLDTTAWSLSDASRVPFDYWWALARAGNVYKGDLRKPISSADTVLIALEFKRLMGLKGAPESEWAD